MSDKPTRRTFIATIGVAGAATLAGCGSNVDAGTEEESTDAGSTSTTSTESTASSDVIEEVTVEAEIAERTFILAEMTDETAVEQVNLISPDGTTVREGSVSAGAEAVEITIAGGVSDPLEPGEYEVVAVDSDETIDRETVELERDAEIREVRTVSKWGNEDEPPATFEIELVNTGSLPLKPDSLIVYGDVPNPHDKDSGELGPPQLATDQHRSGYQIWPGETSTLRIANVPLTSRELGESDGCSGSRRTATVQFTADSGFTKTAEVTYALSGGVAGGPGAGDQCSDGEAKSWDGQ